MPLAVSKTVDLAQLIGLSTYLFDIEGVSAVAIYGVVRAIAPTVGVPLVTATTSRLGPGTLLMWLGIVAAIATTAITTAVALEGPVLTVIGLAAILHVILGAHRPVTSALMPTLVGTSEQLLACTAVTGLLDGVTFLVGPLLAGLLLVSAGPAAVLYATRCCTLSRPSSASGCPCRPDLPRFRRSTEGCLRGEPSWPLPRFGSSPCWSRRRRSSEVRST